MQNKVNVIPIIIGDYFNAYSLIRSFADRGIKSILITGNSKCFVAKSKYLQDTFIIEGMTSDETKFIKALQELGKQIHPQKGMFFPTHDDQLLCLARNKKKLGSYYELPFSEYETLIKIMDKRNFSEVCQGIGVPTVKEKVVKSIFDVYGCVEEFRFPVIVKLDIWNEEIVKALDGKIAIFYEEKQFINVMEDFFIKLPSGELLIQEYIEDSERLMPNVNSVANREGELQCVFVSEKLRQYPPQTGTSTATVSVDPEREEYLEIIEYAKKIVKEFGFYGLFGIEFKYDTIDNCYKVIEMNCRSEFPNYLQVIVGQNMAYYLYKYHLYQNIDISYFPNVKRAICYVPFLDKYYCTKINKLYGQKFVWTKEKWKKSIFEPRTLHGVFNGDWKPYIGSYLLGIKTGAIELYRKKHNIPGTMSMKEYFKSIIRREKI